MRSKFITLEGSSLNWDGSITKTLPETIDLDKPGYSYYVGLKEIFLPPRKLLTLPRDGFCVIYKDGTPKGIPTKIPAGSYHWIELEAIFTGLCLNTNIWPPSYYRDNQTIMIRTNDATEVLLFSYELARILGFKFHFDLGPGQVPLPLTNEKIRDGLEMSSVKGAEIRPGLPLPEFSYSGKLPFKLADTNVFVGTDIITPQIYNSEYKNTLRILPYPIKSHHQFDRPIFHKIDRTELKTFDLTFTDYRGVPVQFLPDLEFFIVLEIKEVPQL